MPLRIEWDDARRRANLDKHGLDFLLALHFDWESARIDPVRQGRFQAIGCCTAAS